MSEIDFINVDQSLSLEQEFGSGYIKVTEQFFDQDAGCYKMASEILDENHNILGNLEVNTRIIHFYEDDCEYSTRYDTETRFKGDIKHIFSLHKA